MKVGRSFVSLSLKLCSEIMLSGRDNIFNLKSLVWLITLGSFLFVLSIYVATIPPTPQIIKGKEEKSTTDLKLKSPSALGYLSLEKTLKRLSVPVSHISQVENLNSNDLLVFAEPKQSDKYGRRILEKYGRTDVTAPKLLMVLPKRQGTPSKKREGWVDKTWFLKETTVKDIAAEFVNSVAEDTKFNGTITRLPMRNFQWLHNEFGPNPDLSELQVLNTDQCTPLINTDKGIFLGKLAMGGKKIFILSDPDILANHAIKRKNNLLLSVKIFEKLCNKNGRIVFTDRFDPTSSYSRPNASHPFAFLVRFPFVFTTVHILVLAIFMFWASIVRFGKPIPFGTPLNPGHNELIINGGRLLAMSGHMNYLAQRYLSALIKATDLHSQKQEFFVIDQQLFDRLEHIGENRKLGVSIRDIYVALNDKISRGQNLTSSHLLYLCQSVYQWYKGITSE